MMVTEDMRTQLQKWVDSHVAPIYGYLSRKTDKSEATTTKLPCHCNLCLETKLLLERG